LGKEEPFQKKKEIGGSPPVGMAGKEEGLLFNDDTCVQASLGIFSLKKKRKRCKFPNTKLKKKGKKALLLSMGGKGKKKVPRLLLGAILFYTLRKKGEYCMF